jgi:tellurite resistance protein TerC
MHDAFHVPLWLWGVALAVVLAVAAADVIHASRSHGREPGLREAALCTAGVVALGALFGLALAAVAGPKASGQFYAGWLCCSAWRLRGWGIRLRAASSSLAG